MNMNEYRYDECGLDNVILCGLPTVRSDDGSIVVTIPHVNSLHRLLVKMVAEKATGLDPKEIRFLRTEMEMTQAELASLVGRDVQTVGRWERADCPIDRSAEIVIRARAFQMLGIQPFPMLEELSGKTVHGARAEQFLVNASDPSDYRPAAA